MPSSVSDPAPDGLVVAAAPLAALDAAAEGTAELVSAGGDLVLRLTSFRVDDGRGYVVYLVPQRDARTPGGGVLLGPLKAVRGDQNYPVPVQARADGPLTVLIWSREFKGPVGHAPLRR